MAPIGMHRRPVLLKSEEDPIPINWRRGLFRVWVLISAAWIMGWIIFLALRGLHGGFQESRDFLEIPILLFGPPLALWLFGAAAGWAFRGFRA
jgi:hypothetical protein